MTVSSTVASAATWTSFWSMQHALSASATFCRGTASRTQGFTGPIAHHRADPGRHLDPRNAIPQTTGHTLGRTRPRGRSHFPQTVGWSMPTDRPSRSKSFGGPVAAFCGIGNPEAFFDSLPVIPGGRFPTTILHHETSTRWLVGRQIRGRPAADNPQGPGQDPPSPARRTPLWAVDTGLNWVSGSTWWNKASKGLLNCSPKDDRSSPAVHRSARA
ncbi:MAG: hypothetical protein Ct9H300mP1_06540 [Planctomycetaceae bacterium]|nr:MAG: hypothetical protein Ct9H300mP1_06540 [Planctomycetaceae bacterium]